MDGTSVPSMVHLERFGKKERHAQSTPTGFFCVPLKGTHFSKSGVRTFLSEGYAKRVRRSPENCVPLSATRLHQPMTVSLYNFRVSVRSMLNICLILSDSADFIFFQFMRFFYITGVSKCYRNYKTIPFRALQPRFQFIRFISAERGHR